MQERQHSSPSVDNTGQGRRQLVLGCSGTFPGLSRALPALPALLPSAPQRRPQTAPGSTTTAAPARPLPPAAAVPTVTPRTSSPSLQMTRTGHTAGAWNSPEPGRHLRANPRVRGALPTQLGTTPPRQHRTSPELSSKVTFPLSLANLLI